MSERNVKSSIIDVALLKIDNEGLVAAVQFMVEESIPIPEIVRVLELHHERNSATGAGTAKNEGDEGWKRNSVENGG